MSRNIGRSAVTRICVILVGLTATQFCCAQHVTILDSVAVFSTAPFVACHASTIVETGDDKLMAAWFGGTDEGAADVCIWMSELEHNKWISPVKIADGKQTDGKQLPCWNPVLFKTRSGLLFLFYKVGTSPRTWWGEMKTSTDNGRHWTAAQKLPGGFIGPVKNKPIQLTNGDLLCPSSIETKNNQWTIHMEWCDSTGNNWRKTLVDCDTFGVIQPSVLQYNDGRLQLLCRSRQNVIAQSWSYDGGKSWERVTATSLPNPNSGSDAVTLNNGYQLLVYNPLTAGKEWWQGRSVLKLAYSTDGKNWKNILTLEDHAEGEYSYPAIIQSKDGIAHITYTAKRKQIRYIRLRFSGDDDKSR